jgi:amino acid adenylation domain-containing protein
LGAAILEIEVCKPAEIETTQKNCSMAIACKLLSILQESLSIEDYEYENISLDENLLSLGANSIVIIKIANRINTLYDIELSISDIYKHLTINSLADFIASLLLEKNTTASTTNEIGTSALQNNTPLSSNQMAMYIIEKSTDTKNIYNIIFNIKIEQSNFSYKRFHNALSQVIERNDLLHSTIRMDGSVPVCSIVDNYSADIIYYEIDNISEMNGIIDRHNKNMFKNIEEKPPVCYFLMKENTTTYHFTMIVHHIFFDGYSINIFAKQLIDTYLGDISEERVNTNAYNIFAANEKQLIQSGYYDDGIRYWTENIKSDDYFLNLPLDYSRPEQQQFATDTVINTLDKKELNTLKEYARRNNLTLFSVLLSAFSILLHRYSGQDEILIGFPYANRKNELFENSIGYYANTIIFRSQLDADNSFLDLIVKTQKTLTQDTSHWDCPMELYYPNLNISPTQAYNPLYQTMFAFQVKLLAGTDAHIAFSVEDKTRARTKADLYLDAQEYEEYVNISFNYDSDIFSKSRIERYAKDFKNILDAIILAPNQSISEYSLLTDAELSQMKEWNNTFFHIDNTIYSVYQLFEEQVNNNPNNIAIYFKDIALTYKEVEQKINIFAAELTKKGIHRQDMVGICIARSPELIIAILSIIKIGAIYVPIDRTYPKERVNYICENSNLNYIINSIDVAEDLFPRNINIINYTTTRAHQTEVQIEYKSETDDTMYVMYTSGSTGKPKGVAVNNKSVINFLLWMKSKFEVVENDVFLLQAATTFDISGLEIFLPLISGSALVITGEQQIISGSFDKLIARYQITILQFVPTSLSIFLNTCDYGLCKSIRIVFTGGAALSNTLRNKFFENVDARLVNMYGPTETTIWSTYSELYKYATADVSIGKPIGNTKIYILDKQLNQIPLGSKGEIFIAGNGLAKEYLNNSEENNKRFIFHQALNERMFRTGDIGSFLINGDINFHGRTDSQVKIRGFRIELQEIEIAMLRIPDIKEVAVMVQPVLANDNNAEPENNFIIAFYTQKDAMQPIDNLKIRKYLSEYIPKYMFPSEFICIEQMPLLLSNKINYAELKNLYYQSSPSNIQPTYAIATSDIPMDNIEKTIRNIWERVLSHNNFHNEENFFEIGGHSLLLLRIQEHIKQHVEQDITLVDLYKYPNVSALSKFIANSITNSKEENGNSVSRTYTEIRDRIQRRLA